MSSMLAGVLSMCQAYNWYIIWLFVITIAWKESRGFIDPVFFDIYKPAPIPCLLRSKQMKKIREGKNTSGMAGIVPAGR